MKVLLSGNEAIARGAYEGGLLVASAYPGTPSTEIFEALPLYKDSLYCEWAPNEKVATEVAYGAAIAGVRSMTAMKHVGVNVAADPIFTAAYLGVKGGFVIVSADDPDLHSSQNEQDNRYYAQAAKIAMIEPSDSQECIDFMKEAFEVSERFDIPVLFRVTTRICHSKSLVELGERHVPEVGPYQRDPVKYCATPARAKVHHKRLEERLAQMEQYANTSPLNKVEMKGNKIGVITASAAYPYAKEAFPEDASFLKLGFTHPLPMDLIRDFAAKVETLYVIEELEPYMETKIRAAGIECIGKDKVPLLYELNPQILEKALWDKTPDTRDVGVEAVVRPPVLCPGCPHRGFYTTIARHKNIIVAGDIGCYTLGGTPPLNAVDTTICMGAGFSAAAGIAKALQMTGQTDKKVFGVVGDSTFFHSGMTGAVEIIYNKLPVVPCVVDNSITGMTGHQDNPGSGETLMGETAPLIRIEDLLTAMGYKKVLIFDPQDLKATEAAISEAEQATEPVALIARRPCLLIKKIKHDIGKCIVHTDKCRSCKMCISAGCPAISIENGKACIDQTLCTGCTVCAQICPFDAIERI